ncbi:odorant receptor 13a-like [Apis laboriosa]|uniref:odorant receptor 13a-like n=1 Tax=Apis laboriosa TaxID=183418 RepID=UPI001CC5B23E|nr:odorant receptor 13a-like [Apis laboriosa]
MDSDMLEKRFLKITKRFAKLSGIWPDQNKYLKYISWIIIYVISIPSVVVQVARIVHISTVNVIVEQSGIATAIFLLLLKEANYILNATKVKSLFNDMYMDWMMDRPKEELEIMSTYAQRGSFLATFYLINAYCCSLLFLQVPWTARLSYMIKSQNTSPPMLHVIPGYYFVDDDRDYYYLIQLHMSLSIIMVVIVYVAYDTCYMVFVQHVCGLLAVAGYRFKHAIDDSASKNSEEKIRETCKRIRSSIQGHERAIRYLKKIEDTHVNLLFISLGLIIMCFSITLLKVVTMDYCLDFYKYSSFLIVQLMHLCYVMIQGQFVIDSCNEIYCSIYEASWYNINPKIQALYIFALRRSLTPPRLTAGGLIELNMQSFSEVIKLSVSYYTVLRST